jgi:hypothetical protein
MPRFAAIENGVVVGVFAAKEMPTINVPVGRTFMDVTELPNIQGGERVDPSGVVMPKPTAMTPTV